MLTLWAAQAECLWDESLPVEVKELPADLAELDGVLGDPELMMVLLERWRQEVVDTGRAVLSDGRPTIAMETYVRLMVLKAGIGGGTGCWWRRCRTRSICAGSAGSAGRAGAGRVDGPQVDPRIGAETVNELDAIVDRDGMREKRFRPRAVRIDSTVVEADVRYPTDADLASHGVRVLAREGAKLAALVKERRRGCGTGRGRWAASSAR